MSGRRSGTTRRAILGGLASVPAAALPGCRDGVAAGLHGIGAEPAQQRLIDAHCHVFNITDLPAASFIQEVFLKDYPDAVEPTPAERRLRWALDKIEGLLAKGVLRAADEAANSPGAGFLAEAAPALSPTDQEELDRATREAEDAARESGLGDDVAALLGCSHGAKISVRSATNWLGSLRSPRARLAMRLRDAHSASGYASALLAPALVDYSNWLGQSLRSPLPDQISAMGALAANPALPPIHGYVAFDPLRRALIRGKWRTRDGERWDPLAQARIALRDHGFIGVKLYPPMGFRPSGNAGSGQSYQPKVSELLGGATRVGEELDASLDELWSLCVELDAPVMAHATDSNSAGEGYGLRADPSYWFPVARAHPQLRVLLAHFGRFREVAAVSGHPPGCGNGIPFEHTWEAAIGRFVFDNKQSLLFADVSYLSELFSPKDRKRCIDRLQLYLNLDPGARHLVFGSDWVMLGIEKEYPKGGGYPHRVAALLADAGLGEEAIDGVMYRNALRLYGLDSDSVARRRLLGFYERHGLPATRLPS